MARITQIAFRADLKISLDHALQVVENEKCSEVYLVGANPSRMSELRAAGLTVHGVDTAEELPANTFLWYAHEGFWGAVHTETGFVRNVGYAEDSLMAARLLMSTYTPAYREQFHVEPVKVERLSEF